MTSCTLVYDIHKKYQLLPGISTQLIENEFDKSTQEFIWHIYHKNENSRNIRQGEET